MADVKVHMSQLLEEAFSQPTESKKEEKVHLIHSAREGHGLRR